MLYRRRTDDCEATITDTVSARYANTVADFYRDEQAEAAVAAWERVEAALDRWYAPGIVAALDELAHKAMEEQADSVADLLVCLASALADVLLPTAGGKGDGDE